MNLAILLCVSEYKSVSNNLPGCKLDGEQVFGLLEKIQKFDEILYINEKLPSAKVKEKISSFIKKHENEEIDEVFFYYTGHGEFLIDEFYFLLSDFDSTKRNQTTLGNEELDQFIKSLKPEVFVKVIDACQSGKHYIKDFDPIKKHFNNTLNRFKICYFLNSSLTNQSSFISQEISDFTKSFLNAVKSHKSDIIRYKDIIDYISDDFENNQNQTPFFVSQASFTEPFCGISESIKTYFETINNEVQIENEQDIPLKSSPLLEKILNDSIRYIGKEELINLMEDLRNKISNFLEDSLLGEIFEKEVFFTNDYTDLIKENDIGRWLDENDHNYFANSVGKYLRKDRLTNPFRNFQDLIANVTLPKKYHLDPDYEWVMTGFETNIELPYKTININFISKFPNVDDFALRIIFFASRTSLRFFYLSTNFYFESWDEKKLNIDSNWSTIEFDFLIKDEIDTKVNQIISEFEQEIISKVSLKFP